MTDRLRPEVSGFTGGPFAQTGYVTSCPETRKALLIDPGGGVAEMLAHCQVADLDVVGIALTHAHIDHVDGLTEAKAATSAPVFLHRDDESLYQQAPTQAQWFGLDLAPLPPLDGYLEEGETLHFGRCSFDIFHTPGHAPGHVIFVTPGICMVGDCVFFGSIGRTDLPGGNLQVLMRSIRGRILTLPDETILHPGHGPATTVGHERVANPFLVSQLGGSRFA